VDKSQEEGTVIIKIRMLSEQEAMHPCSAGD
jgi:hypothetical protein